MISLNLQKKMKTITLDIKEQVFEKLMEFLHDLPGESVKIYDDDPDALTAQETKEIYNVRQKIQSNDYSEFKDWDELKSEL